jgi:hypothetical protein
MADIYLPTLHTFAMKNEFTGSWGMLRFKITPSVVMATAKEVDFEQSNILCQFWHGLYCFEKSTVEEEKTFPMTEEGRLAMKEWLESNI